jgi:hypothetical protein
MRYNELTLSMPAMPAIDVRLLEDSIKAVNVLLCNYTVCAKRARKECV